MGQDNPKTLMPRGKRFSTDDVCRDYTVSFQWPSRFICPAWFFSLTWRRRVVVALVVWVASTLQAGDQGFAYSNSFTYHFTAGQKVRFSVAIP